MIFKGKGFSRDAMTCPYQYFTVSVTGDGCLAVYFVGQSVTWEYIFHHGWVFVKVLKVVLVVLTLATFLGILSGLFLLLKTTWHTSPEIRTSPELLFDSSSQKRTRCFRFFRWHCVTYTFVILSCFICNLKLFLRLSGCGFNSQETHILTVTV